MNDQTPELLPCPFCGYEASMTQVESAAAGGRMIWVVGCNSEDCEVGFHGHARRVDAAKAWNTRARVAPDTDLRLICIDGMVGGLPCPHCEKAVERYIEQNQVTITTTGNEPDTDLVDEDVAEVRNHECLQYLNDASFTSPDAQIFGTHGFHKGFNKGYEFAQQHARSVASKWIEILSENDLPKETGEYLWHYPTGRKEVRWYDASDEYNANIVRGYFAGCYEAWMRIPPL